MEVENMSNTALDDLLALIKGGDLNTEALKMIKRALKPQSEVSVEKEKAQASLDAFLNSPLSDGYEMTNLVGDVLKDIWELEGEVKKHGGTRVKHSTQTLVWKDKESICVGLYNSEEFLDCSDPRTDKVNKGVFLTDGYTIGQWNAVTKYRRSLLT